MTTYLRTGLMVVILSMAMAVSQAGIGGNKDGGPPGLANKPQYSSERILVKPKKGTGQSEMARLHASNRVKVKQTFSRFGNIQVVDLPKGADPLDYIARYEKSGLVESAQPDYVKYVAMDTPNDPYYSDMSTNGLWGLRNLGQAGGKIGADIDTVNGWNMICRAPDVIVAIIDTGVHWWHEDLAANMWVNPGEWGVMGELANNGRDDDGNGYADDVHGINGVTHTGDCHDTYGHGTHVAGTIGAVGNNHTPEVWGGAVGVAWQVQLMACKAGEGPLLYSSGVLGGIDYAIAQGADIMNASYSGGMYDPYEYQALARARDAGIILVTIAGNDSYDIDSWKIYPACYNLDNIVVTGATDRYDQLADFG